MFAATCILWWFSSILRRWIWFNDPTGHVQDQKEYQSLRFTNHITSCPTYWHHILIFSQVLSSIILIWRHHRGHFTVYTVNSQHILSSQNTSDHSEISCQLNQPRGRPHQFARRKPLTLRANQRASSGHMIVCCHHIDPRATMTTHLLMTFIQVKQLYDVILWSPPI